MPPSAGRRTEATIALASAPHIRTVPPMSRPIGSTTDEPTRRHALPSGAVFVRGEKASAIQRSRHARDGETACDHTDGVRRQERMASAFHDGQAGLRRRGCCFGRTGAADADCRNPWRSEQLDAGWPIFRLGRIGEGRRGSPRRRPISCGNRPEEQQDARRGLSEACPTPGGAVVSRQCTTSRSWVDGASRSAVARSSGRPAASRSNV